MLPGRGATAGGRGRGGRGGRGARDASAAAAPSAPAPQPEHVPQQPMPEEPMVLAATRQADEIVSRVSGNKCTLIFGETGCGKSTQVPKILLARLFAGGRVLCTQPRRLAVVAVATRVADELGVEVNGPDVGYIIGLEQQSHATVSPSMLFVTSGYLLQKVKNEGAEALERYSCIILDEVHERSAENDLVLAIVRSLTPPQTKIVLMSATPNHRRLRDYFASSPSGARGGEEMQFVSLSQSASFFDIREKYLEDVKAKIASARGGGAAAASDRILENIGSGAAGVSNEEQQLDDVNALPLLQPVITELVVRLWPELGEDATVIVFLPTWNTLETQYSSLARRLPGVTMHVLHSAIDLDACMEALAAEDARGKRLVLSSPIGESSVTIRNVQHVIDCCRTNQVYWSRTCNEYLSRIEWVSQSQAMQRRGRTGRTCHGTVWRLVPARTYHGFETFETSALRMQSQRKECLLLSCAQDRQLQDAAAFLECCLDAPRDEVVTDALQKLCQMRMIEERAAPRQRRSLLPNHAVSLPRTRYAPTPYGELCDSLPVELTTAEFLLHAAVAGLLPEALILASLSSTTPLPIVRRPLESELYETQMQRFGLSTIIGGTRELLANLGVYLLWEKLLCDPQRWRRCIRLYELSRRATGSFDADRSAAEAARRELNEQEASEEQAWCDEQKVSRTALSAAKRTADDLVSRLRRRNPPLYHRAIPHSPRKMDHARGADDKELLGRFVGGEIEQGLSAMMRFLLPEASVEAAATTTPVGAEPANSRPGSRPATVACTFFLRGHCNRGVDCPFAHARGAERPLCRYMNLPGGCRYGPRCLFRHEITSDVESAANQRREAAHRALASLKMCASIDDLGVQHSMEEANCSAPLNYAERYQQVLALDDNNFLCAQIDLSAMLAAGARIVVATTAGPDLPEIPGRRGRVQVQRDIYGVDLLALNEPTSPLTGPLMQWAQDGTPCDCVLLRCPPSAEVTESFFQSMLMYVFLQRCLAPNCHIHIIGRPELVVSSRAVNAAEDAFFCLIGVHAPPNGSDFSQDDDQHATTLCYVFTFDQDRASNAAVIAPLLDVSAAQVVRAAWPALRIAAEQVQVDPSAIVRLARACVLAFDTEDAGSTGSVVQIGYVLAAADGTELLAHSALLELPGGTPIAAAAQQLHGITDERLLREGVDAMTELERFQQLAAAARICGVKIVAHNAATHVKQLNDTAVSHESPGIVVDEDAVYCTMTNGADFCGLMPSRLELLSRLLPEEEAPAVTNDALLDARATAKSYLAGLIQGVFL